MDDADAHAAPQAPSTVDPLLVALLDRDAASCPVCAYSLKGLRSDRCPECGERLGVGIRAENPRLGWWVCGLLGLASGMGFFVVVHGFIVWVLVQEGWDDDVVEAWPLFLGLVVHALGLALWIRLGRRIRRARTGVRACLAIVMWAVSAILTTGMIWLFVGIVF